MLTMKLVFHELILKFGQDIYFQEMIKRNILINENINIDILIFLGEGQHDPHQQRVCGEEDD